MEYELYHHGVTGMKWGIRRYQNKDGSLTAAGKRRYGTKANFEKVQRAKKAAAKASSPEAKARAKANARTEEEINKYLQKAGKKKVDVNEAKKPEVEEKVNKTLEKTQEVKKTDSKFKKSDSKTPEKKSIKDMTNEEIQAEIDRMGLEARYREAMNKSLATTTANKKKLVDGRDLTSKILSKAGENLGSQLVTALGGMAINAISGKMLGDPKLINPKKGQKEK